MPEQLNPRAVYRQLLETGYGWVRKKLVEEPNMRASPHVIAGMQMRGMMVWLADLLSNRITDKKIRKKANYAVSDYGFLLEKKFHAEFGRALDEEQLYYVGQLRRANYRLLLEHYKETFNERSARKVRRAQRSFSLKNPALLNHENERDLAKIIERTMRQLAMLHIAPHLSEQDFAVFKHAARKLATETDTEKPDSLYNAVKRIAKEQPT